MTIKVMVIDDSALVREMLTQGLAKAPDIEVIATALDPLYAISQMKLRWPDVIILDIEMPRMDGLTFLRKIMSERPTPVIICSSLATNGAAVTLEALSLGAVSIITKPTLNVKDFLSASTQDLIQEIRAAVQAKLANILPSSTNTATNLGERALHSADVMISAPTSRSTYQTTDRVIALGTSTGGTQALEFLLTRLPATLPGIAIVQHMPEMFTAAFAQRLNGVSRLDVKEAKTGDRLVRGSALIAPGGKHLLVQRSGAQYYAEVKDGPLVSRHKPSVDVLFRSVAVNAGRNAIGVIMTGMGDDGARGMRELHDTGARTVAQDEASSVVFGMPKEAIAHGGVDEVMSLQHISQYLAALA